MGRLKIRPGLDIPCRPGTGRRIYAGLQKALQCERAKIYFKTDENDAFIKLFNRNICQKILQDKNGKPDHNRLFSVSRYREKTGAFRNAGKINLMMYMQVGKIFQKEGVFMRKFFLLIYLAILSNVLFTREKLSNFNKNSSYSI